MPLPTEKLRFNQLYYPISHQTPAHYQAMGGRSLGGLFLDDR